ncbi:MAG: penicillin-binding transpeptidase domain-containing protein [Arhodomonas sp.]|nr:penicillin-binding transpeptidase domain-containing protein [Arhodomonas sp.]
MQKVAEGILADERGAIVAIDPGSGEVLALASTPTFDPNLFVNGVGIDDYRALQSDLDRPLFNRALRGQYPPGSTLKPFLGLAGLETGTNGGRDGLRPRLLQPARGRSSVAVLEGWWARPYGSP